MSSRRLAALVGLVLLFGTLVALSSITPPPALVGSARSTEEHGLRALVLVLEELGYEARLEDAGIGALLDETEGREAPGLLLLARQPVGFDPDADPDDPLVRARAGGADAWRSYRRFSEQGGALLFSLEDGDDFLEVGLGLELPGPELPIVETSQSWRGPLEVRSAEGFSELVDGGGDALARRFDVGTGSVTIAGASLRNLANDQLESPGGARFPVRLIQFALGASGEPDADSPPVRFAEFALSSPYEGGSATGIAFGAGRLLTWHLLALAVLLVWALGWAREFPRDPEPHDTLAPLLRASASATLFVRHGRFGALAEALRTGTFVALGGGAGGESRRPDAEAVGALARRLEQGAKPGRAAAWIDLLVQRPVRDLDELVRLDRELRELEREHRRRRPSAAARER